MNGEKIWCIGEGGYILNPLLPLKSVDLSHFVLYQNFVKEVLATVKLKQNGVVFSGTGALFKFKWELT